MTRVGVVLVVGALATPWLATPTGATVEDGSCTPSPRTGESHVAANPNGPYYHQVRLGTFGDGVVEGDTLLTEHGSVPDALALRGGDVAVYFVNGAKNVIARGIYDGKRFRDRRAITIDGVKGGVSAVDPDVIRMPDGTIRLAYFNGFGPPAPGEDHLMCIADSTDGLNFESRAVIFRGEDLTDPSLALRDGVWYLAVSLGTESLIATSTDGTTFRTLATVADGGVPEITTGADGSLHLYVCGRGVVELTSADGVTWSEAGVVLPPGTCDPSVVVGTDAFVYKTFAVQPGNGSTVRPPSPPG